MLYTSVTNCDVVTCSSCLWYFRCRLLWSIYNHLSSALQPSLLQATSPSGTYCIGVYIYIETKVCAHFLILFRFFPTRLLYLPIHLPFLCGSFYAMVAIHTLMTLSAAIQPLIFLRNFLYCCYRLQYEPTQQAVEVDHLDEAMLI